jgi:hypothetical protein
VAVRVPNCFIRVALGKALAAGLTVGVILSASVLGEVRRFVDQGSALGIGASGGCLPESAAEVDMSEARGESWKVSKAQKGDQKKNSLIGEDIGVSISLGASTVEEVARVSVAIQFTEVRLDGGMMGTRERAEPGGEARGGAGVGIGI